MWLAWLSLTNQNISQFLYISIHAGNYVVILTFLRLLVVFYIHDPTLIGIAIIVFIIFTMMVLTKSIIFQVRASAVFVPEFAALLDEAEKFTFAYSIRLSLLPEGCVINGMTFSSCQLNRRHWIIRVDEVVVSSATGEAVIGEVMKCLVLLV